MASLPEKELTLRDLLTIYRRRRRIVHATLLSFVLLGALYCTFCTRRYQAMGTIQIQKESADAMDLGDLMGGAGGASDALGENLDLQTQANILQSDTLALRTIEDLHMEGTRDFQPHWSPVGWLFSVLSPKGLTDQPGVKLENAPERRRRALKIFASNLTVKPVAGTRLIEIDYLNPDPKLASAVVNSLMEGLADYSFQTRYNATNQASNWLGAQLGELRRDSENLQARVVELEKESGVYSLGVTDTQGRELAYSGVLDQLQQATQAVNMAEQAVILKGAIAKAAEAGDVDLLSSLAGNSVSGQGSPTNNAMALIQNLRGQEATQAAALQQLEAEFGPNLPRVIQARSNLAGLDRSIREEIARIKGRAESDYQIALQAEAGAKQKYAEDKKQADQLNDKAIEFAIVSQESQQSRQLYEDLLKRLKEAGILAGLKSSNITVVDPGRVPARPKKPNVPLYMAIALASGFFLGCCGALLVDTLDNKVNGVGDVEQATGLTVLGALPFVPEMTPIGHDQQLKKPFSAYMEAMRGLRTSLMLWQSNAPPKVLLVTSSIAGEGKSTSSLYLAVVLAQHGCRVLLVDTDLRRGLLRRKLNLAVGPGLSSILSGQWVDAEIPHFENVTGLDVLQAGLPPPNPSELLGSSAMQACIERWRTEYDFVVLDGSPVLPVTDSVVLNARVDATLVLVRDGMTEKPQLKRSLQMLKRDGSHLVGVVVNGLRPQDESYYGYYGYHRYDNKYAEGPDGESNKK